MIKQDWIEIVLPTVGGGDEAVGAHQAGATYGDCCCANQVDQQTTLTSQYN